METNELKNLWQQYDEKLKKNWNLNLELLKEMKLQKSKSSMNRYIFYRSIIILFFLITAHYLIKFIGNNYADFSLTAPAYFLSAVSYIAIIWGFYQLSLALLINHSEPILVIQKKIEQLKIQTLRFNQFIFYISYPFVYLAGFTILHLDITLFPLNWVIPNAVLALLWFPFAYWLIKKYNSKNQSSKFWKKLARESTLTPGSASNTLNNSLSFLKEIREFEQA